MGRAETLTLLPMDRWRELMGIHPSHFNGLAGSKAPFQSGCRDLWDQNDREDLAHTIAQAEQLIADALGFWPAPKFITDEKISYGLDGMRSDWEYGEVQTRYGYVICFGTEELTLIEADASVVYTDHDHDQYGREELATIGETLGGAYAQPITSDCDPCDVAVFFREADGAWDDHDPRWEIRPVKADSDGGVLYITAESSLFVKPEVWDLVRLEDPAWWREFDTDHLVQFVDLYCRSIDYELPVTLYWEGVCECDSPCSHVSQTGCAYITDKKRGFFVPKPATWNGTSHVYAAPTYSPPPESLLVNYYAGYPLDPRTCRMDPNLEKAIVKLTNALLPEPPCGFCDLAERRWKQDRANVDPLTPEAASMPWDMYSVGALEAWRIVKRYALGQGGKLGR